ncbi:MAG: type II toxin-antitoxin system VapC family toxin [Thermoplasmatota archaeon]
MNPRTFVVDTSALVDTVQLGTDRWATAFEAVQSKYDILAPLRLVYEVGNIVHRKHPQAFGATLAERQAVLVDLLLGIRIEPWDMSDVPRVGEITEKLGVTFYDATFIDLAHRAKNCVLLVQDQKLHAAATKALAKGHTMDLDELAKAVDARKF